jgi:hypothetical protein
LDSFENTHDLLGDLFGAKNAGVTGGVSDGVGTDRIECARAMPVTYRRDRRKSPLDVA